MPARQPLCLTPPRTSYHIPCWPALRLPHILYPLISPIIPSFYGPGAEFTRYGPEENPYEKFLTKAIMKPGLNQMLQDPLENDALIKARLVLLEKTKHGHALVDPVARKAEYSDMMEY